MKVAFIFIAPETDFMSHKAEIETPIINLNIIGVKNYKEAQDVALELVKNGVTAIELCAGFGLEGTAMINKVVGDKALVGVVRFDIHPGLDYKSGDDIF